MRKLRKRCNFAADNKHKHSDSMCGIVGYIGTKEAFPILIKGLRRLEYRGYDSAGVALVNNDGSLNVYKTNGVKAASLQGTGTVKLASGTYIVSYAGKTAKIMVK